MPARLRWLEVPVLVIQGAEDPRPVAACDSLVTTLPNCERLVMDGAGHFPWVERPRGIRMAVERFLSSLPD
jgi:proline iminopeptidase